MATRTFTFTEEEARLLKIWVDNAWHDADQARMLTRPDSPQEKAAEADQALITGIREKIIGAQSVTPKGYN